MKYQVVKNGIRIASSVEEKLIKKLSNLKRCLQKAKN